MLATFANYSGGGGWGGGEGLGVSTRLINTNKQLRLPHPHILTSMYDLLTLGSYSYSFNIQYMGYFGASVDVSVSKG